ncbi:hypothetical protein IFVP195_C2100340 [Vibrio parahaemolyticus]
MRPKCVQKLDTFIRFYPCLYFSQTEDSVRNGAGIMVREAFTSTMFMPNHCAV